MVTNRLWVLSFALLLPQCKRTPLIKKTVTITKRTNTNLHASKNPPPLTIWIHGTKFIHHPTYYSIFNSKPSLKPASLIDTHHRSGRIAQTLCQHSPETFCLDHFYIFGWSGKLNALERHEAATALYRDLETLTNNYYEQYHCTPYIRVITHSHGGNVALNLAQIKPYPSTIIINELILLACPVQENTKHFVQDPLFEQVYSFYSSLDIIQRLAPQIVFKTSRKKNGKRRMELKIPPLSGKRFPHHEKLTQAKIKINGRAIFHGEFYETTFLKAMSHILDTLKQDPAQLVLPQKPPKQLICIYTQRTPIHKQRYLAS